MLHAGTVFCGVCGTPIKPRPPGEPLAEHVRQPVAEVPASEASDSDTTMATTHRPVLLAAPPSPTSSATSEPRVVSPSARALTSSSVRRQPSRTWWAVGLALAGMLLLVFVAWKHGDSQASAERGARHREVALLEGRVAALGQRLASLESQDSKLRGEIAKQQQSSTAGLAPLAARILKSVYTIETDVELGTAWAAWTASGSTYLITANHVIANVGVGARVTIKRQGSTWKGTVVKADDTNDLALVRVDKLIGAPLWQDSTLQPTPAPGSTIVLVGSPYGLEGTVTTGIVSRVTYNSIQTDAAANPGNSGGPAVDSKGRVLGILVSGGGENLNFTIPLSRACVTIRRCS